MSSASASAQSAPCAQPSRNDATTSSPTPIAVLAASPSTDWRIAASSSLARVNRAIWQARTKP